MDGGGGGGLLDGTRTKEIRRKVVQIISRLADLQSVIKLPNQDEEGDPAMAAESREPGSEFSAFQDVKLTINVELAEELVETEEEMKKELSEEFTRFQTVQISHSLQSLEKI